MPTRNPNRKKALVEVHTELCKGCSLCVEACPQHFLQISHDRVNRLGYFPVHFVAESCSGCGLCFYACPEADGLTIYRSL